MAYAALLSLAQILDQTLNRDYQYLILDEKQQIESLLEKITFLQKDFSSQKITQDEERDIRDAAYIAEDIIESRIIERFRTESAGNEDGSTEKKLVRFNVLEDWIVASSKSAPSRRSILEIGLEIVGVGGVEKPRTRQNINGIRQLARTFRFKAWFLHSDVLHHDASSYETQFLHSDVLHDDASPYSNVIWILKRLATHGTKIVIIINPSMRASEITIEDLFQDHFSRAEEAEPWIEKLRSSTCYGPVGISLELYKSAMVMAGVDAADRCIVVTGDLRDIEVANAAGISSIFMTDLFGGTIDGSQEFAGIRDPTYVLPSFTW